MELARIGATAKGGMAGLELVRTLNDIGYETEAPVEIVAWTNEEGSRFSPAMVGSGAFTGVFELETALATRDNNAPGLRWYEITVTGQEAHAGPTPMPRRRDALVGAARMIDAVNKIGHAHAPYACATVGFVQVSPNSRNTIPGKVFFAVDFRHPQDDVLSAMDRELRAACAAAAATQSLEVEVAEFWYFPPTPFDPE